MMMIMILTLYQKSGPQGEAAVPKYNNNNNNNDDYDDEKDNE